MAANSKRIFDELMFFDPTAASNEKAIRIAKCPSRTPQFMGQAQVRSEIEIIEIKSQRSAIPCLKNIHFALCSSRHLDEFCIQCCNHAILLCGVEHCPDVNNAFPFTIGILNDIPFASIIL